MVVVEANAPSGFTIDEAELRQLTSVKDLQRVEVTKGGTVADIYFNSVSIWRFRMFCQEPTPYSFR